MNASSGVQAHGFPALHFLFGVGVCCERIRTAVRGDRELRFTDVVAQRFTHDGDVVEAVEPDVLFEQRRLAAAGFKGVYVTGGSDALRRGQREQAQVCTDVEEHVTRLQVFAHERALGNFDVPLGEDAAGAAPEAAAELQSAGQLECRQAIGILPEQQLSSNATQRCAGIGKNALDHGCCRSSNAAFASRSDRMGVRIGQLMFSSGSSHRTVICADMPE